MNNSETKASTSNFLKECVVDLMANSSDLSVSKKEKSVSTAGFRQRTKVTPANRKVKWASTSGKMASNSEKLESTVAMMGNNLVMLESNLAMQVCIVETKVNNLD